MRLEGKTALITGASRNIGKEIALTFGKEEIPITRGILNKQDIE